MKKKIYLLLLLPLLLVAYLYFSQLLLSHEAASFTPNYPMVELSEQSSYETIFAQTGLGSSAARKLLSQGGTEALREYQAAFFASRDWDCENVFSFYTREDCLKEPYSLPFADLQPGDIILTLSTHSLGWRHGHAGLVLQDGYTLESTQIGRPSRIFDMEHWRSCSQFAVLRLKDRPEDFPAQISDYAYEQLRQVPYRLTSGYLGPKAPGTDADNFGVHCSYLIWYAYNAFGYDLDSDGGRLASTYDILRSPLLEPVQIYGLDPSLFDMSY